MAAFCTDPAIPRINWFSNPDVVALNKVTGTNDNDCARAIEENMVRYSLKSAGDEKYVCNMYVYVYVLSSSLIVGPFTV